MKSSSVLLFATSVAAEYGYGAPSTSSKIGYTTIYPGHGKQPVTVTAQYQPIPTYVNGKWSSYEAISTVITDAYGNKITVTKGDQDVTVYHTKKTLTHTTTYAAEGYAKPTGYYGGNSTYSNSTSTKTWYELYEEVHEVPYNHVGPHAIPGYSGNPRCEDNEDEQSVKVKQYTGGKWKTYAHTFIYSAPKPSVTSYDAPGTYTIPAKDVTVDYPTTVAVEQTYSAQANKPVTYGGKTTDVTKPTTITAAYADYETKGTVTKTVVHSKTITCNKPGRYTIQEPKTTVYPHDTTIKYPTVTEYPAGVYHHSAETVTITKAHEPYTCKYEQTSTYPVPSSYPAGKPSSVKPYSPGKTSTKPAYPEYPAESTPSYPEYPESTPGYPEYPAESTPSYPESTPGYPEYPAESTPSYPESTPSYPESTPGYPEYPAESTPSYPESTPSYPDITSTPTYPEYPESTPAYPESTPSYPEEPEYPDHTSTPTYPDHHHTPKPSSTKRPHSHKPRPTHKPRPSHHTPGYPEHTPSPTQPHYPDPSSDYEEPAESYGHAHAGYVRRGGVLERRKADAGPAKAAARPVILV